MAHESSLFLVNETWLALAAAALLLVSGFFSAAEAAVFSLGPARLGTMESERPRAARLINKLLEMPRRLIVTLILGSEAANLAAAVLVTWMAAEKTREGEWSSFPGGALGLGFAAAFALVLFAGQVIPKTVGTRRSEGVARFSAFPLYWFMIVLYPLRYGMRISADLVLRAFGLSLEARDQGYAEEELEELVTTGGRAGVLDVTERELLVNLLRSEDTTAADIMTPRHEIVFVSAEATPEELFNLIKKEGYSRLPVYEKDRDRFIGLVTEKDLLRLKMMELSGKRPGLREVMRKLPLVPESRRLRHLLMDFREERCHLALVVDEFGAVSGLVTIEDVLEEIFGEVKEEGEEQELENLGENHWRVLGRMEIQDFNARTGAELPASGNRTLAGLVLSGLGRKPRKGDQVKLHGFKFRILECRGIIIRLLEVTREEESS